MSDEDFEIIEELDDNEVDYVQPSSDELQPGDKVAPGKIIGKNGKVEDSVGKKIVKGAENAAKIGAAVASGGASEGAEAASGASNIAKKKASSIGKNTEENALKGRIKGAQKQGIISKVDDNLADKIDKKAEKNPIFGKAAKEVADKAEVLNTGVGAAESLLSGDMQGFKDNVKGFVKSAAREKFKKVKLVLAGLALAAFAIIIVVEFFIATLSDAWQNFDNKSRKIANNVEKLTNLYRGFGYEDSKSAFYTEMNELDKFYDHKLDIALLLSTVFYSESMGFNKDYSDHLDVIKDDPVNEVLNGDVQGLIDYLVDWEKDIIKESQNTYDENGLVYNAQKIYRLRRLAAAMCDKDTSTDSTMTLKEFIDNEHFKVSKAAADLIMSIGGNTLDLLVNGTVAEYKTLNHFYTFRWNKIDEDLQTFYNQAKQGMTNVLDTLYVIISYCSYGFIDLSSIEYQAGTGIVIHYHPYKVNKDKYDDYLKNYYFEDTPDIKELLPKNEKTRNEKKQIILDDIYRNKNLFKEIFLKYEEESSEEYAEACIGAIDNSLVNELALPVKLSGSVSFDSNSSYGVIDGKIHNGVDLTSSTAGISKGTSVYSIADGVVDSVGTDSQTEVKATNLNDFLFIGDSRYNNISNLLKQYGTVYGIEDSTSSQWLNVIKNGSGTIKSTSITLPTSVNGISVMLGISDLDVSNLQSVLNELHNRYPSVTVYYNSVYHIGSSYSGTVTNAQIDDFNSQMKSFCDSNSWCEYIDITSGLHESNGNLKSGYSKDGLNLTNFNGKSKLFNNIKSNISSGKTAENGGTWIKIKHEGILVNEKEYTFYSVYKNLDPSSVNLNEGDNVSKEQEIGKIGTTDAGVSQLHFEFRNESDEPIDPTNLFIKCSNTLASTGGSYPGDSNQAQIINNLLNEGFNYVQIAAIVTNMEFESSFNPAALNSISCKGISQWCFERATNLVNYTSSKNDSWSKLAHQLTFLNAEIKNTGEAVSYASQNSVSIATYKGVVDYIGENYNDNQVNDAVYYYCMHFEIPGQSICQSRKSSNKGTSWLNDIKSNVVTSSASSNGTDNVSSTGDGYPEGTYSLSSGISFKKYRQDRGPWASNGYSSGTITTSDCGPTSVAILASGLVSSDITPAKTASDMGGAGNGGTNYLKLQNEMNSLGMTATVKHNPTNSDITSALRSGNVMLVSVESATIFTANSHIMAVVDINSDGQVYVINPNSEGRSSSPSGWYDPSELTKGSQYIITTPAVRISNNQ